MSTSNSEAQDDVDLQYLSISDDSSKDQEKNSSNTVTNQVPPFRSPRTASYTSTINADFQAKLLAFQEQRQQKASSSGENSPVNYNTDKQQYPFERKESQNNSLSSSNSSSSSSMASPQELLQRIELQRKKSLKRPDKPLPPLPPTPASTTASTQPVLGPALKSPANKQFQERLNPIRPAPSLLINSQVSPQIAARLPKPSLSQRRGMKLPGGLPSENPGPSQSSNPTLPNLNGSSLMARRLASKTNQQSNTISSANNASSPKSEFPPAKRELKLNNNNNNQLKGVFANFSQYIDIKSGSLNFGDKLSLDQNGVNFKSGQNFSISAKDLEFIDELGRGNYGTVTKVLHKPSQVIMAMKEVRLELDDSKFRQILMELQVLHNCDSPYIVDFFGAFFVEGAVYMCMEFMDGGSLDRIYGDGVDEVHLQYITRAVTLGLKELKDVHNIIHRDVKPTNILVNTKGKVKLCDFGVSGNLVASLVKTNIGCQSYMAPERIKSSNPNDVSYSVQSDVWSLGLTILETAKGCYPYPPETYDNIFSQLSAIVEGPPPKLPDNFSKNAIEFITRCLDKNPDRRPTYQNLLRHPWMDFDETKIDMGAFISERIKKNHELKGVKNEKDYKELNNKLKPALHSGGALK